MLPVCPQDLGTWSVSHDQACTSLQEDEGRGSEPCCRPPHSHQSPTSENEPGGGRGKSPRSHDSAHHRLRSRANAPCLQPLDSVLLVRRCQGK